MTVTVGTFNVNNLFSRFNFQAEIDELPSVSSGGLELTFHEGDVQVRTFMGRLVQGKDPSDTRTIARRITEVVNADVLAVQEVEHIEILRQFNRDMLDGLYPHVALVEGNDARLIDVGLLSKLPIGAITSHQAAVHPDAPDERVFSRDFVGIEILNAQGERLFTLYNTHLKSKFVPFDEDPVVGQARNDARRRRQAETAGEIMTKEQRRGGRFVLAGDMNDPPDAAPLQPMLTVDGAPLVNALANASETRPPKEETEGQGPGPSSPQWTHRFNPPGPEFPRYELLDQIWISDSLAPRLATATIDRRRNHGGDGSDHDPAWIELDL
ncbi:MAG: endonuclease/exonuclease/phosphatase family protein [Myxococcota bacterium]